MDTVYISDKLHLLSLICPLVFSSGPTDLVIDSNTEPLAKAAGEIQKGDYSFRLTVQDEEGEENSADLTVHVVESMLPAVDYKKNKTTFI